MPQSGDGDGFNPEHIDNFVPTHQRNKQRIGIQQFQCKYLSDLWMLNFEDFTHAAATEQTAALAIADEFIAELVDADAVVIGLPIYNFGPPAALKAWADLVARAGTTFRYTETGPEGLVNDKPVYVIVASGGVPVGSPMDLSSTWLTTFLGFIGLTNVEVVAAGQLNVDPEGALDAARDLVDSVDIPAPAAA